MQGGILRLADPLRIGGEADAHADPEVLIAPACGTGALHDLRIRWPRSALLLLAPEIEQQIALLEAGADDVAAHDSPEPLIAARAAALVRRRGAMTTRVGALVIDRALRRVERAGQPIGLLAREFALLEHLAINAGSVVSRPALLAAVWGLNFDPGTNVVAVHMSRLRAKIDKGFPTPLIETIPGRGYRLRPG